MRRLLAIVLLAGLALAACSRGPAAAGSAPAPRPEPRLQTANSDTVPASRPIPAAAVSGRDGATFVGVLLARQAVMVAAESDGRIASSELAA